MSLCGCGVEESGWCVADGRLDLVDVAKGSVCFLSRWLVGLGCGVKGVVNLPARETKMGRCEGGTGVEA